MGGVDFGNVNVQTLLAQQAQNNAAPKSIVSTSKAAPAPKSLWSNITSGNWGGAGKNIVNDAKVAAGAVEKNAPTVLSNIFGQGGRNSAINNKINPTQQSIEDFAISALRGGAAFVTGTQSAGEGNIAQLPTKAQTPAFLQSLKLNANQAAQKNAQAQQNFATQGKTNFASKAGAIVGNLAPYFVPGLGEFGAANQLLNSKNKSQAAANAANLFLTAGLGRVLEPASKIGEVLKGTGEGAAFGSLNTVGQGDTNPTDIAKSAGEGALMGTAAGTLGAILDRSKKIDNASTTDTTKPTDNTPPSTPPSTQSKATDSTPVPSNYIDKTNPAYRTTESSPSRTPVEIVKATEPTKTTVAPTESKTTTSNGFKVSNDPAQFAKERADAKSTYNNIGKTDLMGKQPENAGLRILEAQAETPQGKKVAQTELQAEIKSGKVTPNKDGTITVYRGGKPNDNAKLASVSTDKVAASEHGPVQVYEVNPKDVAVANGLDTHELMVNKSALEPTTTKTPAETTKTVEPSKTKESVTVPKSQLPTGEGKTKVSRYAQRMQEMLSANDKATQESPTFKEMNRASQREKSASFVASHTTEDVMAILKGEKPLPEGYTHVGLGLAMEAKASLDPTGILSRDLTSLRGTRFGQELSMFVGADKNNPTTYMEDVQNTRIEVLGGKENIKKMVGKQIDKGMSSLKNTSLKGSDITSFFDGLRC